MTHPSKVKGNGFERELVSIAKDSGLPAERAYASNGRSLGKAETVDVLIGTKCVQAKRRAALPAYLQIPVGCDAVAFRQDRGDVLVLVSLWEWLDLVKAEQMRVAIVDVAVSEVAK